MDIMYNWDNYINVIDYLKKIYNNTLEYLQDNDYSTDYAQEFTSDIEDFLYYFKIKDYNVNMILDKINEIDTIEFYDSLYLGDDNIDEDTIMPVLYRGTKILLSSLIRGDKRLTSMERRRLYLYQGLIQCIFSFKSKKTIRFSGMYERYLHADAYHTSFIVNNGWLLLEYTLAQELAEKMTYKMVDKIRPGYRPGLENEVYPIDESKVSSNLEMYRMFQEILVHFGLTLNQIGTMYDYSEKSILNDLIKYSINNSFSSMVIDEYNHRGLSLELYQLLYLMGLLINEKLRYYSINFNRVELSIDEVNMIYDNVMNLMNSLISFDNKVENKQSNIYILHDPKVKEKLLKLIKYNEI